MTTQDELRAAAEDLLRVGGRVSVMTDHDVETQARLTIMLLDKLDAATERAERAEARVERLEALLRLPGVIRKCNCGMCLACKARVALAALDKTEP